MKENKAVIFDLDGTLLDTLKDLALSTNAVLERHGYPTHREDSYRYLVGKGIGVLVQKALPQDARREKTVQSLVQEVREEYGQRWADHTAPYPGVPEILDYLEEKKVPCGILSNKPQDFTELTVEAFFSNWSFRVVQGLEPGIPAKPDPTGAFQVARHLGVKPEEIIYLGDTSIDMKTAVSAGMFPAGVLWGFRSARELKESGAEMLLNHPRELLEKVNFH